MTSTGTTDLVAWDHRYLWHPFTQMSDWSAEELVVIKRCNVHGHCKPELDKALREQSEEIAHSTMLGLANVPATILAKRLVEITPRPLTRVFYSDAGATAVEVALKIALQYWHLRGQPRRNRFVGLTGAYHGDTLGAVGVVYSEAFHRFFRDAVVPAFRIKTPHVYRWEQGHREERALELAIEDAERVLAVHGHAVAALVAEPLMQGAAGMWRHTTDYLSALRELTHKHGTLLICDEVATGFGRTGRMFAVEHAAVEPDLLCLGKGITGGYLPLAATLATEEIFDAFLGPHESHLAFFHGHTYTGNPLASAVAVANLNVFEKEAVVVRVQERATRLQARLGECLSPLPHVGDIRQWGLMVGVELVRHRKTRESYDPAEKIGYRVCKELRRRGVMLRPLGNVIVLMPPLSVTEEEIDLLCNATAEAVRRVTE